jgi:hypothetical protein
LNHTLEILMAYTRSSSRTETELRYLYARRKDLDKAIRSLEQVKRLSAKRQPLAIMRQIVTRAA